ncbi:MAG TPA: hypothetical protein PK323_13760, partial [Bacteroidia bacterium]|nr:hypothetical protein [Bacteroidia bacterium]
MKTTKHPLKKASHILLWSSLLLITTAFFPLGLKASPTLAGFDCQLINNSVNNSVNVKQCGTEITVNIIYPLSGTTFDIVTLTFPNSFQIVPTSLSGATILGGISSINPGINILTTSVPADALVQQRFQLGNSGQMSVKLRYLNCNMNNSPATLNTDFLFFDCDGGNSTNYFQFSPNMSAQGLDLVNNQAWQVFSNINLNPISITTGSTASQSTYPGNTIERFFIVNINSSIINAFELQITDEDDLDETSLEIIPAPGATGSTPYPLAQSFGNFQINIQNPLYSSLVSSIALGNTVYRVMFRQTGVLNCNSSNNANVTASVVCGNCSTNYVTSQSPLNVSASVTPSVSYLGSTLINTTSSDPHDLCNGNYEYDLKFNISSTSLVNLDGITIPINTTSFQFQGVQVGYSGSSNFLPINANYISPPALNNANGSITIDFDNFYYQNTGGGLIPGIIPVASASPNNINGAWINATNPTSFIIRIKLSYLCSNSNNCVDPLISLSPNPDLIKFSFKNSCGVSLPLINLNLNNVNSLPPQSPPINTFTTTNSNPTSGPSAIMPFICSITVPSASPFQINANSVEQLNCNNYTYRLVLSLNDNGTVGSTGTISNVSINGTPSPGAVHQDLNNYWYIDISGSGIVTFDITGVPCPNNTPPTTGPPSNIPTFGSLTYLANLQAVCSDCQDLCYRNIGCSSQLITVHCIGPCTSYVHTEPELSIERRSFGWTNLSAFNNGLNPIQDIQAYDNIYNALSPAEREIQIMSLYPYDIFNIESIGTVNPISLTENHTSLTFEVMFEDFNIPGASLTGDFFNLLYYKAEFIPILPNGTQLTAITISNEIGSSYIQVPVTFPPAVPSQYVFPYPNDMFIRKLTWDAATLNSVAGININDLTNYQFEVRLKATFRVFENANITNPGNYPMLLQCQFTSKSNDGTNNHEYVSCDPAGDNINVLIPEVEIVQNANGVSNGVDILLPGTTPNVVVGTVPDEVCKFGNAIGITHKGGNGLGIDFTPEFRPLSAWPDQIISPNLYNVSDYINGATGTQVIDDDVTASTYHNLNNNLHILPVQQRHEIGNNDCQALVYIFDKDCPNQGTPGPLLDLPPVSIDKYAYLNSTHKLQDYPSTIDQFISPNTSQINIPSSSLDCSTMHNFPGTTVPISIPNDQYIYEFDLFIPTQASGLPLALNIASNDLNITVTDFIFNNTPQTLNNEWYLFQSFTTNSATSGGFNASIKISLPANDPCYSSAFNITFTWAVFCDYSTQIDPFTTNIPPFISPPCTFCSETRTFQKGITNAGDLITSNSFSHDGCNLKWELVLTNPSWLPEITFNNLELYLNTGLIWQSGQAITPSQTYNLAPTFTLLSTPGFSFNSVMTAITLSNISILSGESITYNLLFSISESYCNSIVNSLNQPNPPPVITAFFDGNTVCNNDFEFLPSLPIDVTNQNSSISYLITHGCCEANPHVEIIHACANSAPSSYGSIEITNPNSDPTLMYDINLSDIGCSFMCNSYNVGYGPTTIISGLPIGTYFLEITNPNTGGYYTQIFEIEDYSFTVDPIIANNSTICLGTDVVLTVGQITSANIIPTSLFNYSWTPGTNPNSNSVTVTPTTAGITTYDLTIDNGSCTANASIDITVNSPQAPTAAGVTIPINTSTTLTVTAPIGTGITFQWFADQAGTTPLGTPSATYTTPQLATTTSYWVQTLENGCSSTLVEVIVEVVDYCPGTPITGLLSTFYTAGSMVTNTNFSLSGTLTIDHDIVFVGCVFKCKEGAKIYINPNAKATFRNCTLEACNFQLWAGIENAGTVHILDATTISGAEYGLFINNSIFNEVRQSTFSDNYEGIRITSSTNTLEFFNSENNFTNLNQLLPHWIPANSSLWAICGIHLLSVGWLVNIDQSYLVSTGTHFEKINCGIFSTNTDVSVHNCAFNDIYDKYPNNIFYNDGCGIYQESINGNNNSLTVKPYQGITHSQMFVHCLNGISIRNSNATMRYLGFYGCNTGILGNLAFGKRVIMEYNYIEAKRFGIDYNLIDDVNLFVINHNEINLNTIKSIAGIRLNAASPNPTSTSNIKVQDNDVIVNNGFSGIEASSIFHPKLNQNRITRELVPSNGFLPVNSNWAHIRSNASDGIDVSCNNTFMGNNPNHIIDGDGADIQINQSKKSWVACNYTEGISHKGLEFAGLCLSSTIQTNEIGSHGIGLYFDNTADVGMQPLNFGDAPKGNRWIGSYNNSRNNAPAVNENITNAFVIQNNQFGVNGAQFTDFWPDNYPDNDPNLNLGVNWFVNLPYDPLPPCAGGYCPGKPANTGSSSTLSHRMAVAIGALVSSGYPVETKWMQEYQLMKELEDNDSLRNSNDTLLQFYNDSTKLNFKKLYAVKDTLNLTHLNVDSIMIQVHLNDSLLKIIDEEIAIQVLLMNDSSLADTANL